jgi:hypothetical protein
MREGEISMTRADSVFDVCPISDELLGRIYRAGPDGAAEATAALTDPERANIAAFCYTRAHLHEIGLAIAATCDLRTLLDAAGKAGSALHAQSRKRTGSAPVVPAVKKRPISLATFSPVRPWTVIEGGLAAAAAAE